MAQFQTNFSEYGSGEQPADWSVIWDTACDWTAEDADLEDVSGSSFGDKVLKANVSSEEGKNGLTWDDAGSVADADIKARVRANDTVNEIFGLIVRATEESGGAQGYRLTVNIDNHQLILQKIVDGDSSALVTYELDNEENFYLSDDIWYCMRLYINGTTIKGKIWRADEDEPVSWQINTTDGTITDAGAVGVCSEGNSYYDWIGIGTSGDVPPDFPATEASARATQTIVEVSREGAPAARVTQIVAESIRTGDPPVRATQVVIEILRESNPERQPDIWVIE